MSFMLGKHLVFLDSFQFMSSSLDNLVKNLRSIPQNLQVYLRRIPRREAGITHMTTWIQLANLRKK